MALSDRFRRRRLRGTLAVAASVSVFTGCGSGGHPGTADWALPNHDLSSTRALATSGIDRNNVRSLHVAWRFRFKFPPGESGAFTATPVVADGVVFLEDMQSNVFALDLETGAVRWQHLFQQANPGPNGLAVVGDRVYGASDDRAYALSAKTGRLLWQHILVGPNELYVDIAPQVANGLVYVSTIGKLPNGRGTLYALDAATGAVRWKFDTIKGRWRIPAEAGGGGAWYTPSIAGDEVYWGIANPLPWGGTRKYPNGGAFAGPALYTDSLLVLHGQTGKLEWYDQVTAHDVRDHDFQLPPILGQIRSAPVVFGAGKGGIVIAWDRTTHRRIWQTEVGVHRNDKGPLPTHQVVVCPGLLGGVLTPMAYADGKLFVPLVDLCMRGSAFGYEPFDHVDVAARGKGEFVAIDATTGKLVWTRRLPQADFGCATAGDGVVFTSTFDGTVYAFDERDGATLWKGQMRAGINACPALEGNLLLVGAGVPKRGGVLELEAFRP
jgi:outer membrane protein assembly factor BamB